MSLFNVSFNVEVPNFSTMCATSIHFTGLILKICSILNYSSVFS